jgi:metal-dependent amidase/aminoacylase/carboxypeptidase family protein
LTKRIIAGKNFHHLWGRKYHQRPLPALLDSRSSQAVPFAGYQKGDRMDAQSLGALKQKAGQEIDRISARLWKIALDIHSHPEIGWETPKAVRWLTEPLEEAGMKTEIGVAGVPSSFLARWSGGKTDRPVVALLAEYDALRGIGHGCGHNLIGTAAVGAGLAVKAAAPDLPGRLLVIGTPFEEGGGGKVVLVEKGIFDSCDAAMVCHPNNT